jgi:hypothetical protein
MTVSEILSLARAHGVTIRPDGDDLDISADRKPDPELREAIIRCKAEILATFREEERRRPPDVSDLHWETAVHGLRAFIASGHGAQAERLGWPPDELYAVPKLWARVDLCGAGLLIGDREVIGVTPAEIRIKTASGASLAFYRKPQPDLRLVYSTQLKLRRCEDAAGDEEGQLRAFEFTVNFHRERTGADLETAKQAVMTALGQTTTGTTP